MEVERVKHKTEVPSHVPNFDPLEEEVVRCEGCDGPIEISNYYIYLGKPFHEDCLPDESKEVATRVK